MDASALEACNSKGKDKNTTKFKGKTNYKSKGKFGKKIQQVARRRVFPSSTLEQLGHGCQQVPEQQPRRYLGGLRASM